MVGNHALTSYAHGLTWNLEADTLNWFGTDEAARTISVSTGPLVLLTSVPAITGTCFPKLTRPVRRYGKL